MLRGARRTYPSMNVFIFGLGRVIVAYGQCRGSEWQSKLRLQQMSSWSSIPRAASSNPIRKLGRYGPLKMCYFCVMFSFRSELLWKSPNEMLFAWKLFVLLGSLQKPHSRAQKRLTLTDGLCNFLWPDQKGGLQAGNTGLDSILAEFFSWFCRDRFLFEQAGLFPSKQAGLEEDFASYTVQKKSFFRFLVEIFIFSWSWVRAVSWCCEVPSQRSDTITSVGTIVPFSELLLTVIGRAHNPITQIDEIGSGAPHDVSGPVHHLHDVCGPVHHNSVDRCAIIPQQHHLLFQ